MNVSALRRSANESAIACDAHRAVIDRKPVVPGLRQRLEKLSDVSDTAAGRPSAAVNDHDRRSAAGATLHVRIERKLARVGDIALNTRYDVVARGIPNSKRRTGLRGHEVAHCEREGEGEGESGEQGQETLPILPVEAMGTCSGQSACGLDRRRPAREDRTNLSASWIVSL